MSCQAEVQSLVFQAQSRIFRRFRTENGCLARTTLARGRAEHSAGEPAERLRGGSRRAGRGDRFYGRKSRASIRQGEVRRDRGLAGESSRIPSFAGSSRPAARAVRTTLGRDRDEKGPRSGDSIDPPHGASRPRKSLRAARPSAGSRNAALGVARGLSIPTGPVDGRREMKERDSSTLFRLPSPVSHSTYGKNLPAIRKKRPSGSRVSWHRTTSSVEENDTPGAERLMG